MVSLKLTLIINIKKHKVVVYVLIQKYMNYIVLGVAEFVLCVKWQDTMFDLELDAL